MSGSKHKNGKDVAGTAKKHHVVMTEPKVKRIEQKWADMTCSYNINSSTTGTILKDKIMEHVRSAMLMTSTII